jgi:hypothetical protein
MPNCWRWTPFFTWHVFLEVSKTQDLPSKFCQTVGVALIPQESIFFIET